MNIQNLDLNLLKALKALLEEKHVSRAAERVGLSQPAMSRALGRLRETFHDPLLVKGDKGFDLTARALALHLPLQIIFEELSYLLSPPTADPAQMKGEIIIATRDHEMVSTLPRVMNKISKDAPQLSVRAVAFQGNDFGMLERKEADFIITAAESKAANLYRKILYKEDFVCLVAAKNPVSKTRLTLKQFLTMKHCLVTITGLGLGVVDEILAKDGLTRNIVLRIPHFLPAAYIVANSDLIVTLPRSIATTFAGPKIVKVLEPPLHIPSFPMYLYWHARNQNNPVHQWLRKIIPVEC